MEKGCRATPNRKNGTSKKSIKKFISCIYICTKRTFWCFFGVSQPRFTRIQANRWFWEIFECQKIAKMKKKHWFLFTKWIFENFRKCVRVTIYTYTSKSVIFWNFWVSKNRKNEEKALVFVYKMDFWKFSKQVSIEMLTKKNFRANDTFHDGYVFDRTIAWRKKKYTSFD